MSNTPFDATSLMTAAVPVIGGFTAPKRVLMGPGPSDVHPRVLAATAQGTIGHLDPEFVRLMDEIKLLLRATFLARAEDIAEAVSGVTHVQNNLRVKQQASEAGSSVQRTLDFLQQSLA